MGDATNTSETNGAGQPLSPRRIDTLRSIRVFAGDTIRIAHRHRSFQLLLVLSFLPITAALFSERPSTPLRDSLRVDAQMLINASVAPSMVESLRDVSIGDPEPVASQVPWPERFDDGLCVRIDLRREGNANALMRSWRRLSGLLDDDLETDGRPAIEVLAESSIRTNYEECLVLQDPWEPTVLHLAVRGTPEGLPSDFVFGSMLRRRMAIPESVDSARDLSLFAFTAIFNRQTISVFLFLTLILSIPIVLPTLRRETMVSLMEAGASPVQVILGRLAGLLSLAGIPMTISVVGTMLLLGSGIESAPAEVLLLVPQTLLAFAALIAVTIAGVSIGLPIFWIVATTMGCWFFAQFLQDGTAAIGRSRRPPGEGLRLAVEFGREALPRVRELTGSPRFEDVFVTARTLALLVILSILCQGHGRNVRRPWARA